MRDNKGCLSDMKLVTAEKNTGLPSNINRRDYGLQRGCIIKGIAGDDYLTEDAIEKYVDFARRIQACFLLPKYICLQNMIIIHHFPKYRHTVINVRILLRKHIKRIVSDAAYAESNR